MLADDVACNPRNAFPATVFNNARRLLNLYGDEIEVDYRGYDVSVENFIRVLTDRWPDQVPRMKRLNTNEKSNIFVYMTGIKNMHSSFTGHGGKDFLKFQDAEELSSFDLADAFQQMFERKRYNEILFMIANSMHSRIYSPNIIAVGSSAVGENSYSHHIDDVLGVAVIDRFTYYTLEFLENINKSSEATLQQLFDSWSPELLRSNPGVRLDLFKRNPSKVRIMDFFGNVQRVTITTELFHVQGLAPIDLNVTFHASPRFNTHESQQEEKPFEKFTLGSKLDDNFSIMIMSFIVIYFLLILSLQSLSDSIKIY